MKIKTAELIGLPLDWAVAVCEGKGNHFEIREGHIWYERRLGDFIRYSPPTDWSQGGPIIERKKINVIRYHFIEAIEYENEIKDGWVAYTTISAYWITPARAYGHTPLIAVMRCYVASEMGDEIEVPDYLLTV